MPKFIKGELVEAKVIIPRGSVEKFMLTEDGVIMCLISWKDEKGENKSRWFPENDLEKVTEV